MVNFFPCSETNGMWIIYFTFGSKSCHSFNIKQSNIWIGWNLSWLFAAFVYTLWKFIEWKLLNICDCIQSAKFQYDHETPTYYVPSWNYIVFCLFILWIKCYIGCEHLCYICLFDHMNYENHDEFHYSVNQRTLIGNRFDYHFQHTCSQYTAKRKCCLDAYLVFIDYSSGCDDFLKKFWFRVWFSLHFPSLFSLFSSKAI